MFDPLELQLPLGHRLFNADPVAILPQRSIFHGVGRQLMNTERQRQGRVRWKLDCGRLEFEQWIGGAGPMCILCAVNHKTKIARRCIGAFWRNLPFKA